MILSIKVRKKLKSISGEIGGDGNGAKDVAKREVNDTREQRNRDKHRDRD